MVLATRLRKHSLPTKIIPTKLFALLDVSIQHKLYIHIYNHKYIHILYYKA